MPEESRTPDLVELVRRCFEAISAADLDEAQRVLTHDAVVDMRRTAGVVVHGLDAIRASRKIGSQATMRSSTRLRRSSTPERRRVREVLQTARPTDATGHVSQREAHIWITEDRCFVRVIVYPNSELDEARATAARIAMERG
jgi:ketosteroid isomerase-like protein